MMAQYLKTESIGSIGSMVFAILEVKAVCGPPFVVLFFGLVLDFG